MKKYIKSSTKINTVDTFEKLMKLAHKQVICAVSANIYDFDILPPDIRNKIVTRYSTVDEYNEFATDSLDKELALSQYKYFETFGGWVEPDTGKTVTESSFIVLGPEYDFNYFGADNSVESFRQWAIGLCKKYHQWAVLVIDGGEDIDSVPDSVMKDRIRYYRRFYDKNYMTDEYRRAFEEDNDLQDEYNAVERDLKNENDYKLYSVRGTYYDEDGKVVKEYNNITSRQIGNFFTQLARHQGADSFTLTADTHLRVPYIVTSLRDKYRNHTLKDIYAQRETVFYKQYVSDLWNKM